MRKRALVVVAGVLIAIVSAIAVAGAGATTTPARVAAANRSLAIRTATGLLAGLSLPSDSSRSVSA